MKLRPLHDLALVKRKNAEKVSAGGILIPETGQEKPLEGEVVRVGNGRILLDGAVRGMDLKPGDKILFSKYAGSEIQVDGEQFLLLREEDVLCILE